MVFSVKKFVPLSKLSWNNTVCAIAPWVAMAKAALEMILNMIYLFWRKFMGSNPEREVRSQKHFLNVTYDQHSRGPFAA